MLKVNRHYVPTKLDAHHKLAGLSAAETHLAHKRCSISHCADCTCHHGLQCIELLAVNAHSSDVSVQEAIPSILEQWFPYDKQSFVSYIGQGELLSLW